CWRLEDDLTGTGARLCITPDNLGVRLQTIVGKVGGGDEAIRADGVTRPITDQECKGTERAEWSSDGQRVFRHTDVTCGNEPPRKVSSIAFVMAGPAFINVQLVDGGPNQTVRVQRYRRSFDQTLADGSGVPQYPTGTAARATTADDGMWTVEDVIEAAGKVPGPAVQAAVAESKGRFIINKKSLVALADAGVTETTIDLMIGLAYPERFVVERRGGSGGSAVGISMGGGYYDPFMGPLMLGHTYADCYGSGYGYGYRSYYSACGSMYSSFYDPYFVRYSGYNNYGTYYPGGYYPGGFVGVDSGTGGVVERGDGRVVNGRGYTQVRPRESEPAPRTSNSGNGTSAGWSGASSGGVSSQGYSGGSSSG
ncbi:MAG: hypothetical protein Q8N52_02180, partial [Acidobacteriota bacterium]|nr:hypothetical protein [Acidobacteriota bacterium]